MKQTIVKVYWIQIISTIVIYQDNVDTFLSQKNVEKENVFNC